MRFLKSYNNSVALVKNEQGKEEIVIGKGIGFWPQKGDQIDQEKIERRFITAKDQESIMQLKDISTKTLELTTKVIKLVEPKLNIKFNATFKKTQNIVIALGNITISYACKNSFKQACKYAPKVLNAVISI